MAYDQAVHEGAVRYEDWIADRRVPFASTNAGAPQIAFQGWRTFKEAFAPELVHRAINDAASSLGYYPRNCADPFGGSGTTAITCQFLGVKPTTIEVNPFLADLIRSKLETYDHKQLRKTYLAVLKAVDHQPGTPPVDTRLPPTFVEPGVGEKFLFWAKVSQRFWQHAAAIDQVAICPKERRLLRTLLSCCSVGVSNAVVSGKGRRYRKGWQERSTSSAAVDAAFRQVADLAFFDLRRFQDRKILDYRLLDGDARVRASEVGETDLVVSSPPYPNSFDYTDVYNIELWMGGYLTDSATNRALREQTLRSHVQISRLFESDKPTSQTLIHCYDRLADARNLLWNKSIPEMITAYFSDLKRILRSLSTGLSAKGQIFFVVGDSRYAGIDVPVAQILREEAGSIGLRVVSHEPFRSMRASPQQGGREELVETLLVFGHD